MIVADLMAGWLDWLAGMMMTVIDDADGRPAWMIGDGDYGGRAMAVMAHDFELTQGVLML